LKRHCTPMKAAGGDAKLGKMRADRIDH
jgi:hypothetical protein